MKAESRTSRAAAGRSLLCAFAIAITTVAAPVLAQEMAAAGPPQQAQDGAALDLSGRWAQLIHQTSLSNPAIIGEVTTVTRTYAVVDLDQDGEFVSMTPEVCDISVETSSRGVRTEIPREFVDAVDRSSREGRIRMNDDGVMIVFPRRYSVLGAELSDMEGETLPDDADDLRVRDADGDGNPGVTVRIRGIVRGEIYLVQRAWSHLLALDVRRDTIAGNVQWGEESEILRATSPFLRMQPDTQPHFAQHQNYFRMVRVDDDFSCRDLRRAEATLFDD